MTLFEVSGPSDLTVVWLHRWCLQSQPPRSLRYRRCWKDGKRLAQLSPTLRVLT
jgi:hypothetical protein